MKKRILIILGVFIVLLIVEGIMTFEMHIDDFYKYRDIPKKPTKIIVEYEDAYIGTFEITDEETIDEVCTMLFEETVYRRGLNTPSAGSNSRITLLSESGKEYVVSLHIIKTWGRSYFCHSDLHAKLYEIGTEMGALKPH